MTKKRKRRDRPATPRGLDSPLAALAPTPCRHAPGSTAKIQEMQGRFLKRRELGHPADPCNAEGVRMGLLALAAVVLGHGADDFGDYFAEHLRRNHLRLRPGESTDSAETDQKGTRSEYNTPAGRLRKARQRLRWSRWRLAKKAGMSESNVALLESGGPAPQFWTLYRLAEAMDVRIDWLCCLERPPGGTVGRVRG